ncbi:P-type conjugative transfer protein TrbG [Desulforhopalus singaporensis]|uniref:Type IV secretion system protein VirB9 n=1 Tax=Desulforhopalus singaporensis TaxID=91360 RepID=A0A1H0S2X1_9BACT|nr:P-type conjugative transfer protein TrbG [Desulforhopalus singaporensis]SDP35939.1 type IV secretion system protein VirB9 [Desulforhopalus singaporensis]
MKTTITTIIILLLGWHTAMAEPLQQTTTITIDDPTQITTFEMGSIPSDLLLDSLYVSPIPANLTKKEKQALELAREWKGKTLKPVLTDKGRVSFIYGHAVPTIIVSPFKVADLELQPGEKISSIILGDTARWQVDVVDAGSGNNKTSHIAFKVLDSGLSTTALITTDRRSYHLNLKSDPKKHMGYTGFIYPKDTAVVLERVQQKIHESAKQRVSKEGFDLSKLDFNYDIKGNASWKPVQIFNDGEKTYIRMPKMQEMPVLLVKTAAGQGLVNYRVKDKTFIVDQLFEEGYLIVGVGNSQKKVTIKRKEA